MIKVGHLYGVRKWIWICRIDEVAGIRRCFGHEAGFNIWIDHADTADPRRFVDTNLRLIERAVCARCQGMKFWYKPEFNHRTGFVFDDPRLDRIFTAIADAGLPALVHIADPDIW